MGSIAVGERNKMLDALTGRATYTASAAFYVKLHTGDPGAAGANNAATETTRQAVTFGSAAATGAISNTAQVQWTSLAATETISHVSFWTASTAGTFKLSYLIAQTGWHQIAVESEASGQETVEVTRFLAAGTI